MDRIELLDKLLRKDISKIMTTIERDGVKYYLGEIELTQKEIEHLTSKGILASEGFISLVSCPRCGEYILAVLPTCPKCQSNDIVIIELVAHVKCGYIGSLSEFTKIEEDRYKCPNCGEVITSSDLIYYGTIFKCQKCDARFETPALQFHCVSCGHKFRVQELNLKRLPTFSIDKSIVEKLEKEFVINFVKDSVLNKGNSIRIKYEITGLSGITHKVPLLIETPKSIICIYPVISEKDLTELSSIVLDLPKNTSMLILCKTDNDVIRSSCKSLKSNEKIKVVEFSNYNELPLKIREVILNLIS